MQYTSFKIDLGTFSENHHSVLRNFDETLTNLEDNEIESRKPNPTLSWVSRMFDMDYRNNMLLKNEGMTSKVTGDNVSALAFCDVDDDSKKEMLVGTEDYEIRVLRQEYVLKEIAETDVVRQPISRAHACILCL